MVNGPNMATDPVPTLYGSETSHTNDEQEKEQVLQQVERIMAEFRDGAISAFKASSGVFDELDKWANVSDEQRQQAFQGYFREIQDTIKGQDNAAPLTSRPSANTFT